MKTTILSAGQSSPHAGWAAVDELAVLLARIFEAEIHSPKKTDLRWPINALVRRNRFESIESRGGNVLIVVARNPGDLAMANAISGCREKFDLIYGLVTDSYFHDGYLGETALYDAITVTAHEDIVYPKTKFGITVHQLYQGIDCLTWAPRSKKVRDIDLIGFGRMPPRYHHHLAESFHRADSPFLYLHSPLGHLHGAEVMRERGMLFKLLHRSRISLAFHLFVEPEGARPRSMMVTSRWLESLLSGCIVAGKRPISKMADEMLFWPGATTELSDDPESAIGELYCMLEGNDRYEEQRSVNISNMIAHHDWRYRIRDLCIKTGMPEPPRLQRELEQLEALGKSISNDG